MKKILLITTIALFSVYVQPAYSLEIDYDTGQTKYEDPGDITQTPDSPTMEFGGEAGDSGLTEGSGTQTDSGGTDDSGDDTSGDDTSGEDDSGEKISIDITATPQSAENTATKNEVIYVSPVTPFSCYVQPTCEELGFTVEDTEKCAGRIALPCPFDENLYFCSKPDESAITEPTACAEGEELVSGVCRPACPSDATRVGDVCVCTHERKFYSPKNNECICERSLTGDDCDACLPGTKLTELNGELGCIPTLPGENSSSSNSGSSSSSSNSGIGGGTSVPCGCLGFGDLVTFAGICEDYYEDNRLKERYKDAAAGCR